MIIGKDGVLEINLKGGKNFSAKMCQNDGLTCPCNFHSKNRSSVEKKSSTYRRQYGIIMKKKKNADQILDRIFSAEKS